MGNTSSSSRSVHVGSARPRMPDPKYDDYLYNQLDYVLKSNSKFILPPDDIGNREELIRKQLSFSTTFFRIIDSRSITLLEQVVPFLSLRMICNTISQKKFLGDCTKQISYSQMIAMLPVVIQECHSDIPTIVVELIQTMHRQIVDTLKYQIKYNISGIRFMVMYFCKITRKDIIQSTDIEYLIENLSFLSSEDEFFIKIINFIVTTPKITVAAKEEVLLKFADVVTKSMPTIGKIIEQHPFTPFSPQVMNMISHVIAQKCETTENTEQDEQSPPDLIDFINA